MLSKEERKANLRQKKSPVAHKIVKGIKFFTLGNIMLLVTFDPHLNKK